LSRRARPTPVRELEPRGAARALRRRPGDCRHSRSSGLARSRIRRRSETRVRTLAGFPSMPRPPDSRARVVPARRRSCSSPAPGRLSSTLRRARSSGSSERNIFQRAVSGLHGGRSPRRRQPVNLDQLPSGRQTRRNRAIPIVQVATGALLLQSGFPVESHSNWRRRAGASIGWQVDQKPWTVLRGINPI
jgi:hypothetical protein